MAIYSHLSGSFCAQRRPCTPSVKLLYYRLVGLKNQGMEKWEEKSKGGIFMPELNPFKIAQAQLDEAAKKLGLDEATHELLRWPQMEFKVTLPVEMDDGKIKIFHGYRVQYNGARGPTKGGTALASGRNPGHGARPRGLDDLEDGGGGHSPGWRQGRGHLQPQGDVRPGESSAWPGPTCGPWRGSSRSPRTCPRPMFTPRPRSWPG